MTDKESKPATPAPSSSSPSPSQNTAEQGIPLLTQVLDEQPDAATELSERHAQFESKVHHADTGKNAIAEDDVPDLLLSAVLTDTVTVSTQSAPPAEPAASASFNPALKTRDNAEQWTKLEDSVQTKVLIQLQNHINEEIETRLRQALERIIGSATSALTHKIGLEMQGMLEAIIAKAIEDEVKTHKNQK